ncbi:hypothetical protein [Microvirga arsenatis]|uniref:DUF2934 domain-containing protein n=1 Tax=Microvirga arsenatis TaxID=2692265 RepID=A0ABW9YXK1_9HYPH|nr:hypothetical protein [Microvirga arsenatis]NBJ13244.1 hypothetical protein [Microvirga arsenatis]NBJ25118.1 hypothetical protein [Microvirga arsenatis]
MSTKLREAFEHWASDEGKSPEAVKRNPDGHYRLGSTNMYWRAWQAAWQAAQAALSAEGQGREGWVPVSQRLPVYGEGRRVVVHTDGYDFAGEQFFDIKADALTECGDEDLPHCGDREVAARASHWIYVEDLAHRITAPPPVSGEGGGGPPSGQGPHRESSSSVEASRQVVPGEEVRDG